MSSKRLLIVLSERGTLVTSCQSGPSVSFTMALQADYVNGAALVCGFFDLATSSAT